MDRRRIDLGGDYGRRRGNCLRLWRLGREIGRLWDRLFLVVSAVFFVVSLRSLPSIFCQWTPVLVV